MMDKLNRCIFSIKDDDLLEKYKSTWDNVSTDIKNEFNNMSVFNKNI